MIKRVGAWIVMLSAGAAIGAAIAERNWSTVAWAVNCAVVTFLYQLD